MDSPRLEIPQSIAGDLLSSTVYVVSPSDDINFAELWTYSRLNGMKKGDLIEESKEEEYSFYVIDM